VSEILVIETTREPHEGAGWSVWSRGVEKLILRAPVGTRLPVGARQPLWANRGVLRWAWEAPLPFDREQAHSAGMLTVPEDLYVVVVRETPEKRGWLVHLGVSGPYLPGRLATPEEIAATGRKRRHPFNTPEDAAAVGLIEARRRIAIEVEVITQCRGGRLDWGTPIELNRAPIVIYPQPGERAVEALRRSMP
jgi:hypothetical protein